MATVLERLAEAFQVKTDGELAEKLAVPRGTVSSWRTRGDVPAKVVLDAASRSSVSLEWLVNGRGPKMVRDLGTDLGSSKRYLIDRYSLVSKPGIRVDLERQKFLPWPENSLPVAFDKEYLATLGNVNRGFIGYTVEDDAMEPTIKKGSTVLVESSADTAEISDLSVHMILYGLPGTRTFRRIRIVGSEVHLFCDNPERGTEIIEEPLGLVIPDDLDMSSVDQKRFLQIRGRAVWSGGPIS